MPDRYDKLREVAQSTGSKMSSEESTVFVVIVILAIVLAFLIIVGMRYSRTLFERLKPFFLYMDICRQVGLGFWDRWWLWQIARQEGLSNPIALLLSPTTLRHHVMRAMEGHSEQEIRLAGRRIDAINSQLFGLVEE